MLVRKEEHMALLKPPTNLNIGPIGRNSDLMPCYLPCNIVNVFSRMRFLVHVRILRMPLEHILERTSKRKICDNQNAEVWDIPAVWYTYFSFLRLCPINKPLYVAVDCTVSVRRRILGSHYSNSMHLHSRNIPAVAALIHS